MASENPNNPTSDQPAPHLVAEDPGRTDKQFAPIGPPEKNGRWRRVARRTLVALLTLAVLAGVGLGVYYGWPIVYDRYIRPVEVNTADVVAIQERVSSAEARLSELESVLATAQDGIASLEQSGRTQERRIDTIDGLIAAQTDLIAALEAEQSSLEAALGDMEDSTLRQMGILKSMELLSRARLFLYQANYGLARQDIATARSVLADLDANGETTVISDTLFRLDLALGALPDRPVLAIDDLDIAWGTLLDQAVASTTSDRFGSTTSTSTTTTTTTTAP